MELVDAEIDEELLLTRYHKGPDGKPVKKALVYTAAEHGIQTRDLDQDAVRIIKRLKENGHDAYIVGGAVRDLLLGRHPKDYDIVTDAQPPRIKKLFYRSRIIGRRFRLVHVYAGPKIFEVSTFRSIAQGTIGNEYGTIDEDALRRDFSINALYFDPVSNVIVDYIQGMRAIRSKKIVPVIPLKTIFSEDPVRMLRAIKYSVNTGFDIGFTTRLALKKNAPLLAKASISRLGEEAIKIFTSANCHEICLELFKYKLLAPILPGFDQLFRQGGENCQTLKRNLVDLDEFVYRSGEKDLAVLLTYILHIPVQEATKLPATDANEAFRNALNNARDFLFPVTLPRISVEKAVRSIFITPEPRVKLRKTRKRRRRNHSLSDNQARTHDAGDAQPGSGLDT